MFLAQVSAGVSAKAAEPINIATGSAGGLYFAAGEAICKAMAAGEKRPTPLCSAVTSRGSMANVLELDPVKLPFAIIQSDIQYNAVTGGGLFATVGADSELRSVLSLHEEAFTVLVRADSGISTINDLKTRKFSAGRIGTGTRETAEALFDVLGWTPEDRKAIADIPVDEQSAALCAGTVDGIAFLIGHPSPIVAAAAEACPVALVPVAKAAIEGLTEKLLYYRPATIAGGLYKGTDTPITTIGLRASVVTTAEVPDRVVHGLVASVFGNLQIVRDAAPAFADLVPAEMSTQGLIAPLHPAALEFYRAHGLPTPSVEITPAAKSAIDENSGGIQKGFTINPKLAPMAGPDTRQSTEKPAHNTVPVGPGQKWKLESGDLGASDPALAGDGPLPEAGENLRLKIPATK